MSDETRLSEADMNRVNDAWSDFERKVNRLSDETIGSIDTTNVQPFIVERLIAEVRHWRGLLTPDLIEALGWLRNELEDRRPETGKVEVLAALDALLAAAQEVERG